MRLTVYVIAVCVSYYVTRAVITSDGCDCNCDCSPQISISSGCCDDERPTRPPPTTTTTTPTVAGSTSVMLNTGADVTIDYSYRVADAEVDFEVSAVTTNWLAIGFTSDRAMTFADVVVGFGSTVQDRYAFAQAEPSIDAVQDITNTETTVVDGTRTVKFTRGLTGTGIEDFDLTASCPYLLVAVGGTTDEATGTLGSHTGRAASGERWCVVFNALPATG